MSGVRLFGSDLFGDAVQQAKSGPLARRFEFPPFSVLSARDGQWQERKRAWLSLGIQSEVGRGTDIVPNGSRRSAAGDGCSQRGYGAPTAAAFAVPKKCDYAPALTEQTGTSIFDPVLTELCYRWFCPPGGQVVDPFAGGSVRGIVAALLGYRYWGCDLRHEQVDANRWQAATITPDNQPEWVCGDALDAVLGYPDMLAPAPRADFVFSCPPYGDLERYSDDPRDLSTMEYHTFAAAYKRIIQRACTCLNDDRFACFVVGDFRDKRGHYRGFVHDTVAAFREQGLELYNDAVLITAVGSLPVRVGKQFAAGRKLGKTHQNILVFVKGDWRKAASACNGTETKGFV